MIIERNNNIVVCGALYSFLGMAKSYIVNITDPYKNILTYIEN